VSVSAPGASVVGLADDDIIDIDNDNGSIADNDGNNDYDNNALSIIDDDEEDLEGTSAPLD
jgi:hypothetical protein